MSISYVPDTWIHDFQFSQWFIKVGIINFILKIRRLRHREVKWFAQGHIVDKWQSWELKTWEFNSRLYSLYINKHPSDQLEIYVHFYYDLFFPSFPEINIIMKIYMYSPFLLLVLHYCIYTTFIKTHTIFCTFQMCLKGPYGMFFCNLLLSFKMNRYDLETSLNSWYDVSCPSKIIFNK